MITKNFSTTSEQHFFCVGVALIDLAHFAKLFTKINIIQEGNSLNMLNVSFNKLDCIDNNLKYHLQIIEIMTA